MTSDSGIRDFRLLLTHGLLTEIESGGRVDIYMECKLQECLGPQSSVIRADVLKTLHEIRVHAQVYMIFEGCTSTIK